MTILFYLFAVLCVAWPMLVAWSTWDNLDTWRTYAFGLVMAIIGNECLMSIYWSIDAIHQAS